MWLNEIVKILLAIIIRKFFPRFDPSFCVDHNAFAINFSGTVWLARVVYITGKVVPRETVYDLSPIYSKKILAAISIRLIGRNDRANIFNRKIPPFE